MKSESVMIAIILGIIFFMFGFGLKAAFDLDASLKAIGG